MIEAKFENLDGILDALKKLGREASKRGGPVKAALFQAAKVIRESAKQKAVKSDTQHAPHFKDRIASKRDSRPGNSGAAERYTVGVKGGARLPRNKEQQKKSTGYWRLVEFGSEHNVPRPFLVPAFNENTQKAIEEFARVAWARIDKIAAKIKQQVR